MTGYVGKAPESFGIVTDNVDTELTNLVRVRWWPLFLPLVLPLFVRYDLLTTLFLMNVPH